MATKNKKRGKRKNMEVSKFNVDAATIKAYFDSKVSAVQNNTNLKAIFAIAVSSSNFSLFPTIAGEGDYKVYIDKWIGKYEKAIKRSTSTKKANPKSAASDPSVWQIAKTAQGLTDAQADAMQLAHNLFMSAENVQGDLLEDYIASVVTTHGFLYTATLLRAVDFCSADGAVLLQVKNKSNTENSSSSAIRSGDLSRIKKWFRLGTQKINGVPKPIYKWNDLNAMVKAYSDRDCTLSEDGYIAFIRRIVAQNPKIVTDK